MLLLMCGPPLSGKSTVAIYLRGKIRESDRDTVIVSTDAIREELYGRFDPEKEHHVFEEHNTRVKRYLENGFVVISDQTHWSREYRQRALSLSLRPWMGSYLCTMQCANCT